MDHPVFVGVTIVFATVDILTKFSNRIIHFIIFSSIQDVVCATIFEDTNDDGKLKITNL